MKTKNISRGKFITLSGFGLLGTGNLIMNQFAMAGQNNGYISLFNGYDLTGWHKQSPKSGRWTVDDGVLLGEQDPPGSGNGGFLFTDRKYGNFELIIDMKPDWGIDTGVFLRANEKGQGIQIYVDYHEHGDVGRIRGMYPTENGVQTFIIRPYNIFGKYDADGKLLGFYSKPDERDNVWDPFYLKYNASPEQCVDAWKIGEWNTMRVRCVGKYPRITVWINSAMIADFDGETCPNKSYDDIIVITDSMRCAGLPEDPDKKYKLGEIDVIIDEGVAWLEDRSAFAGSVATMYSNFKRLVSEWNVPINEAVRITSYNQAKLLGIIDRVGEIKQGREADILLLDRDMKLQKVIKSGVDTDV